LFESSTRRTEGKREAYTLTCERKDGTVLQEQRLFIDRGERVRVDFSECRRKW
jgi:hypothetical protein